MRDLINLVEEAQKELLRKEIVLKDGTAASVVVTPGNYEGKLDVVVYVNGELAGMASFGPAPEGYAGSRPNTWTATTSWVNEEWRRKGVNTAIYTAMEELGHDVVPEIRQGKLSPAAQAFWKKHNPAKAKAYGF